MRHRPLGSLAAALLLGGALRAQELQLRSWSAQDGLAHQRVNAMLEDARGYLWAATWEGISRFDGRSFESFGTLEGLPSALVFALATDPEGRLWVAPQTQGVARFVEDAAPAEHGQRACFRSFRVGDDAAANSVDAFLFDARGLWVATPAGVFRARERDEPRFERVWSAPRPAWALQAYLAAGGRHWIVTADEVLELDGDTVRARPGPDGEPPRDSVNAQPTPDGRALIVTTAGLFVFDGAAAAGGRPCWSRVPFELPADDVIHATAIDARGRLFLAGVHGLLVVDGARSRRITDAQGLPDEWLRALYLDRAGTLWIGSNLGGLTSLREPAIETFLGQRARERMNISRVLRGPDGTLYATANDRGILRLESDGLALLPGSEREPFRSVHVGLFCDRSNAWWLGTSTGVWRARGPALELARAESIPVEGGGGELGEFFQDVAGRILVGGSDQGLYALDPAADAPRFARELASEALGGIFPRSYLTTGDGTLWIATNEALWRRTEGGLERVRPRGALALEQLEPRALLQDSRGALWVGTRHAGVAWTREPSAAQPEFERLSTRDGLPSDHAPALAEDEQGRVWIGTGRGLARFEPESRALRCFGTADGLAGETVNDLLCDEDGALWAACAGGLSRLDPRVQPAPSPPPPIYVARFEAGGRAYPLPASGVARLGGLELAPTQRAVGLAFTGIDLVDGPHLRFQHRLVGLEPEWSEPSAETSVRYGSLEPGAYRFEVRALTYDGIASEAPARVEFRLAAPLWRRAWFAPLALALAGAALWSVLRLNARRRHALERIRSQIATDLHDEVGSSLAQIAILSEVARREGAEAVGERLGQVAELARETRGSMADLVWAVDPRCDTLADLLARMRTVTANLLGGEGLELVLRVPSEAELAGLALAPDKRRHLLLFFKEAVHNVARHAGATRVEIELVRERGRLRLSVRDDGCGFDPAKAREGQGLVSLRRRAQELGGTLRLESRPGGGTRVELDVAL